MEKVEISKKLYDSIINENIRLRIALSNCMQQLEQQKKEQIQLPIEKQISIEEYTKTLKK